MEAILAAIFWLGQSCFVIQTSDATILADPFDPKMGYAVTKVEGVHVVTISHEHFDHNNMAMAAGTPLVLRGLTAGGADVASLDQKVRNVRIRTVPSLHSADGKRGKNAIFVFDIEGAGTPLRIVHMGDFGEKQLGAERIKALAPVDVLLLPVGGFYTIGPAEANQILADLKPRIVVPMHWKTAKTAGLPIQNADEFLKGKKHILRDGAVSGNRLDVSASLLKRATDAGEPLIALLDFGPPPAPKK
ncbi:MAG: MBL fold metallo-hydrolase [Candidatus Sumerlaeia bacterium]|nr:MBL fold metallo-hydrolase [Candidatus Sumerlaeia bacterium]